MLQFSVNGETTLFPLPVILHPQKTLLLTDRHHLLLPIAALGLEACASEQLIFLTFLLIQLKSSHMEEQVCARQVKF